MASKDFLDFPLELCSKPAALVGLCGLDVQNNFFHRTIWELFNKGHEQSKINFKIFNLPHTFPHVKAKKSTYDSYIPKGLLKKNWMKKHLLEIPSVLALLFELNWDDPNSEQLKLDCVARIQAIRTSLGNHATKIVIILMQKIAPLPDDVKATEKAKSLCAACEIEMKQLFVLPHGDHLQGYIVRLESALYDLTQNYYHQEIKIIKQHKDQLNKTIQQYLFVRHNFKLGFLSELKQDNHNAKKYYEMAYAYLKEVRISDMNIVEVKLIAGFITYKLSYLMFKLNQPRDSISNFKLHIEYYKNKIGLKELIFEHYSWLSKQYSAFADIFNDAVGQGLIAVQTQHPGFYYQAAAQYSILRKNSCFELCKDVTENRCSDLLKGFEDLEYFGQRPWRQGQLSAEPINSALESQGIEALKWQETLIDHSGIIISQLGSAISQFKTYRCPRMRLQLVVEMAEEYFFSKDYGKALTLFSHILWDYKEEKWWLLLSTLLTRALSCAYVAANLQDYIIFSIEALNPLAKFDLEKKKKIFKNLMSVLQLKNPEPEAEIPVQSIVQAHSLWEAGARTRQPQTTVIELQPKSCIEAKARFVKHVFNFNEISEVEVYIRSSCPYAIEFSQVAISINFPNHSVEHPVTTEKANLRFEPGLVKMLLCKFKCDSSDINKIMQIGCVILTLGNIKERSAVLKINITSGNNELTTDTTHDEFQFYRLSIADPIFDKIENLTMAKVVSAESKLKIQVKHESPALLNEWYPLEINILNDEDSSMADSVLEVKLQPTPDDVTIEHSTQLCTDVKNCIPSSVIEMPLNEIPQKGTHKITIFLRGHRVGERNLIVKLNYDLTKKNDSASVQSYAETLVKVPIVQPFDVSQSILSLKFEEIEKCFTKDPFILSPTIHILSPWPIAIHHTTIEPSLFVKFYDKNVTSHLAKTLLNKGERGTDMFTLVINESSEQPLALGTYIIQWSREGRTEITNSSVTMPTVMCEPTFLGVEMYLPAHGWVRQPMQLEYNLCNYTNNLLQVDLLMEASDAFMFAGKKQVSLRLLPGSIRKLKYNLYPLFSGLVALPRLVFKSSTEEFMEQLNQMIDRNLLSHVYVMPQEKIKPLDSPSATN